MADARGGHAGGAEQLAADQLGEVARVLHRVGQVELVHAVEELVLVELVHVEGQARLVVDAAKAAGRPFDVDADLGVNLVAVLERRLGRTCGARGAALRVPSCRWSISRLRTLSALKNASLNSAGFCALAGAGANRRATRASSAKSRVIGLLLRRWRFRARWMKRFGMRSFLRAQSRKRQINFASIQDSGSLPAD